MEEDALRGDKKKTNDDDQSQQGRGVEEGRRVVTKVPNGPTFTAPPQEGSV